MSEVNLRKMWWIGIILTVIAQVFGIVETNYFGSNWLPESKEELFCDFIGATVFGAGLGLIIYATTCAIIDKIRFEWNEIKKNTP